MFQPQLKLPEKGNPYYIKAPRGFNPCIYGNNSRGQRNRYFNVLPNCVGWSVARFNEVANVNSCIYLGNTDAKNFVRLAWSQGLKVDLEPKLGDCICWTNAENGHVANVENILEQDEKGRATKILVSESGWNSNSSMWNAIHYRGDDGQWIDGGDAYWMRPKQYHLVGFIHQPKEIIEMTQEEFNKMADNYIASRANLKADNYAKPALKWAKEEGIFEGDDNGNLMPKSFLMRQDFAVVLKRISEKVGLSK